MNNLNFNTPKIMADFNDNSTFTVCPTSVCTQSSWDGENLTFNVSHFTTYKAQESTLTCTNCSDCTNKLAAAGPGDTVRVAYLPLPRVQKEVAPVIPAWTEGDFDSAVEAAQEVFRNLEVQRVARFDPLRTGRRARGPMATLLGRGVFQAGGGS